MPPAKISQPSRLPDRRNRDLEIVDAAVDVFWEKGFSAASIQDIADRVGLLKGSLYHYIDSKGAVLDRIVTAAHDAHEVVINEIREMDAPPLARLEAYVDQFVYWCLENQRHSVVYFNEWRHLEGKPRELDLKRRRVYKEFVNRLLDDAKLAGDVPASVDTNLATLFILGAINAAPTWFREGGENAKEEVSTAYARLAVSTVT